MMGYGATSDEQEEGVYNYKYSLASDSISVPNLEKLCPICGNRLYRQAGYVSKYICIVCEYTNDE